MKIPKSLIRLYISGEDYYYQEQWNGKYECEVCSKSFDAHTSLTHHMAKHSGHTACTVCGKVLSRTAHLKRHIEKMHPENLDVEFCQDL